MRRLNGWLSQWRRGPVGVLIGAWIAGSAAIHTLLNLAAERSIKRFVEDIGYRLGATSVDIHVNFADSWLQTGAEYFAIAILPPLAFFLLWRRARS